MDSKDIVKCHFIPISTLKKVMEYIEAPIQKRENRCKPNLLHVQSNKLSFKLNKNRKTWFFAYQAALRRAIYSHNWNTLAFIMKKSPIWEHRSPNKLYVTVYIRALTILLMNHPSSKAQLLLNDYLHMVLACRSDEDKKAVIKTLLSLPDKLYGRRS